MPPIFGVTILFMMIPVALLVVTVGLSFLAFFRDLKIAVRPTGALRRKARSRSDLVRGSALRQHLLGNANYNIIARNNGIWTVTPAPVIMMADAKTRAAGDANPVLTYALDGSLLNGDHLSGALATTVTMSSPAGDYPINQGSLAASSNYSINYQGALLTILAAVPPPRC